MTALRELISDMFETMYEAPGIGLAATQVDVHKRLLVADVSARRMSPGCSSIRSSWRRMAWK